MAPIPRSAVCFSRNCDDRLEYVKARTAVALNRHPQKKSDHGDVGQDARTEVVYSSRLPLASRLGTGMSPTASG